MEKKSSKKRIPLDAFTTRLLAVYRMLEKSGLLRKRKKDFAAACLIEPPFLVEIANEARNFPLDEAKRGEAKENLLAEWQINPRYMDGNSERMLLRSLYEQKAPDPMQLAEAAMSYETSQAVFELLLECQTKNRILEDQNKALTSRIAELETA